MVFKHLSDSLCVSLSCVPFIRDSYRGGAYVSLSLCLSASLSPSVSLALSVSVCLSLHLLLSLLHVAHSSYGISSRSVSVFDVSHRSVSVFDVSPSGDFYHLLQVEWARPNNRER